MRGGQEDADQGRVVSFRVWPPVALGVPLAAGIGVSRLVGDPVAWPRARVVVAAALAVMVVLWNGWGLVHFRRHATGLLPGQPTTELMTDGPFAISRNPLYVGLVALYVAIAVWCASTWALALLPVAVLALRVGAIEPEERFLRTTMGPAYEEYCRTVRRWL